MQITRQSEYAIKTILELASIPYGQILSTSKISERQDIPEVFLKKTVQLLARGGLVATQRGPKGGVRLIVPANQITIAHVIKAIEGEIAINPCLGEGYHCQNESFCQIRTILKRAQDALKRELSQETLQDILERGKECQFFTEREEEM